MSDLTRPDAVQRLHRRFVICDGFALGILANAPVIALRQLESSPLLLALGLVPSGFGILVDLYVGRRMARSSKVPYVAVATGLSALAVLGMTFAAHAVPFNLLHGIAVMGQIVGQMAMACIVRDEYPAAERGRRAGQVRRATAASFFAGALMSAALLDWSSLHGAEALCAHGLLITASLSTLLAAVMVRGFWGIEAHHREAASGAALPSAVLQEELSFWAILRSDRRYRSYLVAALTASFGGLMIWPYVNVLFVRTLDLGYLATVGIVQLLPQSCAFLTCAAWGRFVDRRNPWTVWAIIRTSWGVSFIVLALAAAWSLHALEWAYACALFSKVLYGVTMGGSWILFWQVGVGHFAPSREATAPYMGLQTAVSGLARVIGPAVGGLLLNVGMDLGLLFLGGGGLLLWGAVLSERGAQREAVDERFATIAAFEASLQSRPKESAP